MFDTKETKDRCVSWIREFFEQNGPGCNAVVGISGGKDSSVVAALCAEALGKDRVIGVLMPCGEQPDIKYAYELVEHLGIRYYVVNIQDAVEGIKKAIPLELSAQTLINLPARIRMSTLYAVSQSCNGRVANTCNLSEDWVGYSTRYGDAAGDFSPCCHLTVAEVKEIGRLLGLPEDLIEKKPSDGLTGKTDEDNLGFTYAQLDRYIRTGLIDDEEKKANIDRRHKANLFKLQLMPSFVPSEKLGLVLGRFQGLHLGHQQIIDTALENCSEVLVFIGSSQESGTATNPFSYETRRELLRSIYGDRLHILPLPDIGVGNTRKWGDYVLENVRQHLGKDPDLIVSGEESRRQSWYSGSIDEINVPKTIDISASMLRKYLADGDLQNWQKYTDPRLWDRFGELRQQVLASADNIQTKSI